MSLLRDITRGRLFNDVCYHVGWYGPKFGGTDIVWGPTITQVEVADSFSI